jgi:SpoVK/Ycf46/Vps4 family AAA+-type ATPase
MADDPVVLALRAALAGADSIELRLALGERLLALGDARAALAEYERALALQPSHTGALEGARRAAESAGETAKSAAYALASTAGKQPAAEAPILKLVPKDAPPDEPEAEKAVTFADVGGMEQVKTRLDRAFLGPVRNPEMYKSFGREIRGGLVLFGPPGCGKTFIARALAGEIGAKFIDIGLSDVLDMWFGQSEQKLHELFENARRQTPSVIFLDEVDALGQRRSQLRGGAGRTLVNQLLAELDGFKSRNTGVFVLGATNHPWDLDPALRRPGRFDQLVFVPPPDAPARKKILELKLGGRPTAPKLDLDKIARTSDGFSGADLQALVDAATDVAIERSERDQRQVPIDDSALALALKDLKPSARAWLETARNYALYSNEGGMLDDLLAYLKKVGIA